jgi:hypothetical protein
MAAVGGAAAAVIVGVAALAGAFSGPGGRPGQSGVKPPSQSSGVSSQRASSSVLGTATARPTPRPSAASPEALCRQLTDDFMHPTPESRAAENTLVQQLSKLAGGQLHIIGYCARQSGAGAHGYDPGVHGGAGGPAAGNQPGGGGFGQQGRRGLAGRNQAVPATGARFLPAGLFRAGRTAQ